MSTGEHEPPIKKHHSAAPVAMEMVCGAAAGLALGVLAGPPGMVIGAAVGGLVGAGAGIALRDTEIERDQDDTQLDVEIGVFGGHLGEVQPPPLEAGLPPAAPQPSEPASSTAES
jgi:hypothetical protein